MNFIKDIKRLGAVLYFIISIPLFTSLNLCGQKINGMSYFGPDMPVQTIGMFEDIKSTNANWVALIPEATINRTSLEFIPDEQNYHWGETIEANIEAIQLAKKAGLKVFLKPHVVLEKKINARAKIAEASWRGEINFELEADWKIFETNYKNYIIELAKISHKHKVDLFAIGTELKSFVMARPEFWNSLIKEVKDIYSGPITYAANWDEYQDISFWAELDFIGVDTYFPINKMETPRIKKTVRNWKSIQKDLKKMSVAENRQILLTEFGYRNVSYAGKEPWIHDKGNVASLNNETQANLYQAFFQTFWDEPWIAGGFSWKWFAQEKQGLDTSFSIQGKPALEILQKWYSP